jgi:hypothetical protein
VISAALLRAQASAGDSLSVSQRALAGVMGDVLSALSCGEDDVVPPAQPWQVEQRARDVWRPPIDDRSVVDAAFVRSVLEPLLAGDRGAFRSLLGALGREFVQLSARGVDGQPPNVTALLGYQQLRTLQSILNGILHASRVTLRVPAQAEVSA